MERILLTGASGFLGSALTDVLSKRDVSLLLVSRRKPTIPESPSALIEWLPFDLLGQDPLERIVAGRDTIFHLAGWTARVSNASDEKHCRAINLTATERLVTAAAREATGATVVLSGSESQHDWTARLPLTDTSPTNPVTCYDRHKTAAECILADAAECGHLRCARLRLPTLYGKGPAVTAQDRGAVALMTRRALAGLTIDVYGDGAQRRDFLEVRDAAAAMIAASQADLSDGTWLVSGGANCSILELAHIIAQEVAKQKGKTPAIRHVSPPGWLDTADKRDVVIDDGRFRTATGWKPQIALNEGIADAVRELNYNMIAKTA
jgi:dTDP-4-keto-6-deoxyhexose 4-ketoreductase